MMKTRLAAAELCACFVYLSSSGSFLLISPFLYLSRNDCLEIMWMSVIVPKEEEEKRRNRRVYICNDRSR